YMGGYCFFHHAAIAAQAFLARGAGRVALLAFSYPPGTGTQDIFYDRADVLFTSLAVSYPPLTLPPLFRVWLSVCAGSFPHTVL
ncbi:hypothetical protein Q2451_25335, partial [Escherichia coli]|nr:hypothetical protein [Escherichia coli]